MMNYIDMHSHLLPGVDDGARDLEMSMKMFKIAEENGIRQMILTPHNKPAHHNVSPKKVESLIMSLQKELSRKGSKIQLYAGNELYYRSDILEELEEKKACTMAGSAYVLVEFNPADDYDYIRNGIYLMIAGGYRPILAHAERYGSVCTKAGRVEDLIEMGCYIQVNAGSIMGQCGLFAKQFTRGLLKQQLIHFVATDAHNPEKRGPYLGDCGKYISKKYGVSYAQKLLYENPMHIINDEYI